MSQSGRNNSGFATRGIRNSGRGGGGYGGGRGFSQGGRGGDNRSSGGYGGGRGQGRAPQRIKYMRVNPEMLIKKAEPKSVTEYKSENQFSDFQVLDIIKKNIETKGYKSPSAIQDQIIPKILEGKDVIGLASTGTGKTAAFLIPLLDKVERNKSERVLIIVPTRELALQIMEEGKSLARGTNSYFTLVIGGVDIYRQMRDLERKPAFVVGTPGRLKDLMDRGSLKLYDFKSIVLDEVDRMLDMGFIHEMRNLISQLPKQRHSLFFSATMSPKAEDVARSFLNNPITVKIDSQRASDNVDQDIVVLNGRNKLDVLHDLLTNPEFERVIIFGRTKHGMERLSRTLADRGFSTVSIHGNKTQNQRQRALNDFKNNRAQVLLATDVAARGIHIDNVTHVINYELPETYEDYIHRIGRTGRQNSGGMALTFID